MLFYFACQFYRVENINFALKKLDGFIIAGFFVFFIARFGFEKYNLDFLRAFVFVGITVLILTVAYKLSFGFWDRTVRFFLNGPIVFGWLMSIVGLSSLYIFAATKDRFYLLITPALLLTILWTGSKGPLVAFFVAVVFFLFLERRLGKLLLFGVVFFATLMFVIEFGYLPERFLVFQRILSNDLQDSDFGSLGARQAMLEQSVYIFKSSPLIGVGMSNWSLDLYDTYLASFEFEYPHNIVAEVFSEYGLFGGVLLLILFSHVCRKCDNFGRAIFSFALVSLLFSGDMSYWRFLIFFPLVFSKELRKR